MSRRSRTLVIVDNFSGHLFPETAVEKAGNADVANPHLSVSSSASSNGLDESSDNVHSVERDPSNVVAVTNSRHQHENGQPVDRDEAVSQPRPNDIIERLDDAGDSIDRSGSSDDATMRSKISEPRGCPGAAPPSPEESDGDTATDSHSGPASQDGRGEFADRSVPSAGIKQMGCAALAVHHGDSHNTDSVVAPDNAEDTGAGTNHIAIEADKEPAPARTEPADGQAVLRDGIKDGLDRADTSVGTDDRPQTADPALEAAGLQPGGESQETEQGASVSEQCADVATSATGTTTRKSRQSHPKVIVKERDYLSNSEEEILDRLIALNAEQHEVPQTYPSDEVEAGYKDLKTANVTCTKTVQRNIPKLMKKGFIDRVKEGNEIRAGSRARYRINSEDEVTRRRLEKGITHYVEFGLERETVPDPESSTESGA
jgi:hypothetical protein